MSFHSVETTIHTDFTHYTMRRVEHVCNDVVPGVNANYNDKFAKRKVSLSTGAEASNNVILPLH